MAEADLASDMDTGTVGTAMGDQIGQLAHLFFADWASFADDAENPAQADVFAFRRSLMGLLGTSKQDQRQGNCRGPAPRQQRRMKRGRCQDSNERDIDG